MRIVVPKSARSLHSRLLNTVMRASFPFMTKIDAGSLMNRFNQDLMFIDTALPMNLLNTASEFFTSFIQIILVTVAVYYTLAVLPFLCLLLYGIQNFYLRTSKQLRQLDLESKAALHSKFLETCSGISTLRAFGWSDVAKVHHLQLLDTSQEPFYLLLCVQRWLQLVLNLLVGALTMIVLGAAIGLQGKVNPSALGVAFVNVTTLGDTLTNFIISWTTLETSLGAVSRIDSFCKETIAEREPENPQTVSPEWPSQGRITYNDASITYSANGDTPVWALRNLSLEINPGAKVAVYGRTGSGKSSFVLSLAAIVPCVLGSIVIDGVDIASIPSEVLRGRLHAVPQDVFILAQTNRTELDPLGELDDDTVINVLERCGIWDKIKANGGLDGSSNLENLSAGEAQLFCVARAILSAWSDRDNGGVVILDEATGRYVTDPIIISHSRHCNLIPRH